MKLIIVKVVMTKPYMFIEGRRVVFMTKTEIKNAPNNKLIISLIDTYTVIVGKTDKDV